MAAKKSIKKRKNWGFDVENIDRRARPQDDFYQYANGGWLRKNKIPPEESRWGSFIILRYKTERQLKAIVDELLKRKYLKRGSYEQLVRDTYLSATDMKKRNVLGIKPIAKWREEIRGIDSQEALQKYIAKAHRRGLSGLFAWYLDQDAKNSRRYLMHFYQGGLGLPDRDYYLLNGPEQQRVRAAYQKHMVRLLKLSGIDAKQAERMKAAVMKIETELARISMSKEEAREVDKTYHKKTVAQFSREAKAVDWRAYLKAMNAPQVRELVVAQPKFFTEMGKMLRAIPLADWKMYLEWHLVSDASGLLSEKFVKANFDFYGRVLSGSKKMRALWRRGLGSVNGTVGEALGKIYVERYFTASAKRRMNGLVDGLFAAYEARIKAIDWMSAGAKRKAIAKLHRMERKIGYPSKWEKYAGLQITPNDYFGNLMRTHEFGHKKVMRRLKRPVDRKIWFMSPQTVNAYNHFNLNEIVFPAAILQAPFFGARADMAVNYGAIGAVIGHEITHGFDDQGSKFDGNGNMRSWWTPQDRKRYMKKAKILVTQYNQYEIGDGVKANGQLTLGENIADLGGVAIAYDAYQKHLEKTGRTNIGNLTPEQRFFLGFAQSERELTRPEFAKLASLTDQHSVAPLRVNGVLPNFTAFYEAFNVKKGDNLYKPPSQRARIW